jgi:hypothetical protein
VLAFVAAAKQSAFLDHARGAAGADQVGIRVTFADAAAAEQNRCALARHRLKDLGVDPLTAMTPIIRILGRFDGAHAATSWWEWLLSTYLSHGLALDFQTMLSEVLHPSFRPAFDGLISECPASAYERALLGEQVSKDTAVADRLSLWGRRVAGDAIGLATQAVSELSDIEALAASAWPGDPVRHIHSHLSLTHSRRMAGLGLAN